MNLKKFSAVKCGIWMAAVLMFSFPSASQTAPGLSDAEVASVAVTANQIDIDYAQIALRKSGSRDVLQFARTMANDHKAVIDQAIALAGRLKLTPKTNSLTEKLLADAGKTRKMLQSKKGKAFDKAYADNEVAYHKAVISAVESVLIPETDHPDLKALLSGIVPALKAHLGHAEMLQKMLSK